MKLKVIVLLIALFPHIALLKTVKKSTIRQSLNRLSNQLARVKGFKTCNLFIDRSVKRSQTTDMLQSQLTKMFPIVSMGKRKFQISKYRRTRFTEMINWRKREQKGLLNCASGNAILIAVVGWMKKQPPSLSKVRSVYYTLAQQASIPKMLVICMTRKKQVYKRVFNSFTYTGIIDVDILEISEAKRNVKGFLRRKYTDFTVHKHNPFLKSNKKQALSKNVTWFQPKCKNLNAFKLRNGKTPEAPDKMLWRGKLIEMYHDGPRSNLGLHFMASMNMTFKYTSSSSPEFDFYFEWRFLTRNALDYTWLKSYELEKSHLYTPVIYDSQFKFNFNYLLFYIAAVVLTLLLLQLCCVFGNFDRRTWSPYEVVKMLFGYSNPRRPNIIIESSLFCLISLGGVCIANFFAEAMTDMLVPVEEERSFNTFVDLRESNITLYLCSKPAAEDEVMHIKYENAIILSNVSYQVEQDWVKRMVSMVKKMQRCNNISISVQLRNKWELYGTNIAINGKIFARRSNLIEYCHIFSYPVQDFSPYYERMSDLYWRFNECGFSVHNKLAVQVARNYIGEELDETFQDNASFEEDSEAIDNLRTDILLYVLLLGVTASLLVLFAELVLYHLTK